MTSLLEVHQKILKMRSRIRRLKLTPAYLKPESVSDFQAIQLHLQLLELWVDKAIILDATHFEKGSLIKRGITQQVGRLEERVTRLWEMDG